MFVRRLEDLAGTDKEMVKMDGEKRLKSGRLLTKADGCGFSLSDVLVSTGWVIDLWYKNHVEGNLVVSGDLGVEDLLPTETAGNWAPETCTSSGPKTGTGSRPRATST